MSNNVVEWIVEEINVRGERREFPFSTYEEAIEVYNDLKVKNEQNFLSIQKSAKKLLLE
jgi:hypothetical protein